MVVNLTGQQLGNYRLISLLGAGGFAEVYLGRHIYLNTQAAIKVMSAQLTNADIEQFRIEASNLAQLMHPNIVRVLDFGLERRTPFIVMDYAPNGNLRQRYPRGVPLPPTTILPYVKQIASALQYAHESQLIHRDIKPENMLLGRNEQALLSDFGLAVMAQSSRDLTTREIAGTIAYMAPEQLQGKPRRASDQYSLGVVIYEWLSGDRLFSGTTVEIVTQHISAPPPPLRARVSTISPSVEQVVCKALEKDAQKRFASVQEFAQEFERLCLAEQFLTPVSASDAPTIRGILIPKTREQLLAEGNAFYDANQYETALAAYEQAIQVDPNYAPAYVGKGVALRNLKRYEETLQAYDQAIQLDPYDPSAYTNKGNALNDLQRYEEALIACDQAIQLNPTDPSAYNNKGRALNGLKRYGQALLTYERVIQLNPNYAIAYYNKGNALSDLKQFEEALEAFDRAIQLNPNYASAYTNKGGTLNDLQRYEEALVAFDRALQLNPRLAIAANNKGYAFNQLKRYEEALQAFDYALQINPNYANAYKNRGMALESLGRAAEAQEAFQRARELS
jgi:tetratricopeptide (TPR) repeat protein